MSTTERADPRFDGFDGWPLPTQIQALFETQLDSLAAVRTALPGLVQAAQAAIARLSAEPGGRLVYAGAGTSARLGAQDGTELEPTFDWPRERLCLLIAGGVRALTEAVENAEDDIGAAQAALAAQAVGRADVVIALAASGATPYTLACLRGARAAGALTIGIANNPDAPLLQSAEHPLLIDTGAEPIAGSTRLKAGTAQKVVLNLLSTSIMAGLGHVYRGRMVDMLARNDKLRRRAVALVRELAGCPEPAAHDALQACAMRVKPAILVAGDGLDPQAAIALLALHNGRLRSARESLAAQPAGAGSSRSTPT